MRFEASKAAENKTTFIFRGVCFRNNLNILVCRTRFKILKMGQSEIVVEYEKKILSFILVVHVLHSCYIST